MRVQARLLVPIAILLSLSFAVAALAFGASDPYAAALAAVAKDDTGGALPLFEQALEAAPDDLRVANDYRKAVIAAQAYDRALDFFQRLTAAHPKAGNAWLNYGYAYVDKIPVAGSITRVILANGAITQFGKSIQSARTWVALYTRGNSYNYWPTIFGRAPLAVTDLEEALGLARREAEQGRRLRVHARTWVALGDAYWKTDRKESARSIWREGIGRFPDTPEATELAERLARIDAPKNGQSLDDYLAAKLDPAVRVDTSLDGLWSDP